MKALSTHEKLKVGASGIWVYYMFSLSLITMYQALLMLGPEYRVLENLEASNKPLCCNLTTYNFKTPAKKCLLFTKMK
jgi:hypothetical protein